MWRRYLKLAHGYTAAHKEYGHLFAQDRAFILQAMNQAVSRLYVQDDTEGQAA